LREVELISFAVHRNLLRLIGFCTTQTERLLVYPFMQNLSVAYRIRGINFHTTCPFFILLLPYVLCSDVPALTYMFFSILRGYLFS
jgi:hypothetical protein